MDGQRQSSSRRRRSRRSRSENESPAQNQGPQEHRGQPGGHHNGRGKGNPRSQSKTQTREAPILIAARRPNAPATRPKRRFIAASAAPRPQHVVSSNDGADATVSAEEASVQTNASRPPKSGRVSAAPDRDSDGGDESKRRPARIVQVQTTGPDDREKLRLKLIDRLLHSEGRVAITRAARELESAGFDFPVAQDVQLQLLEHFDEACAHQAICQLAVLLNEEAPIKRPLFEQRLRRLEEFAEDAETREAAANLRRAVRA